jgi:glycosyltransferase involved in cell wall biosynthesis
MKALLVLYFFPPAGGPGVQRGVKLCRYLPDAGVEVSVVTVEPTAYEGRKESARDASLGNELPANLRVVRTASGDRTRLRTFLRRAHLLDAAWSAAPRAFFELRAGWFRPALAAALAEVERSRPDVVLTSAPPYVAHLVGLELKRDAGVPWVADFRDPWTLFWTKDWPSQRALAWEEARERDVLLEADAVVANTPGQRRELLERWPEVAADKVHVVPNGYDPADFDVAPAARPADEVLVVHTGSFTAPRPARREREPKPRLRESPYDRTTHSPEQLFQALAALRDRPAAPRVRARFVGTLEPAWLRRADELGVLDRVEHVGFLPHRDAVAHALAADVLYAPTLTRKDGRPSPNVPQKTYEYLGSGREIAALCDDGDVRDLMSGRARCTALAARDAAGLADLLGRREPGRAARALAPDPPDAWPWRRTEQAKRMAEILRRAAGR